jgi:DMSO/TMAO reductase YedYZ molybdopterin-dependent catalytic subunit
MFTREMSRREVLRKGGVALAGLTVFRYPWLAQALQPGEEVIAWQDQPLENPVPEIVGNLLRWEELDSWITPNHEFFYVSHYGNLAIDEAAWQLEIDGMVERPLTLTLDELQARPRQEIDFTLECSGNHGLPFFIGGIGNAGWAGTPLAPLLEEAGVQEGGVEVVFFGSDAGEMEVRDIPMTPHFARSMSLEDAMNPLNLLAYEMNGEPLPQANGFPLRLIAPGWYGVANVKWLKRIELRPSRYNGSLHGARLRDHPRRGTQRRNGVDGDVGRPGVAQVRACQSHPA